MTLKGLITNAYDVHTANQVQGLPSWAITERFEVRAKMDEEAIAVLDKLPEEERRRTRRYRLQSLLAARFQLKAHSENRVQAVYILTVLKDGPKFRAAQPSEITSMQMSFGAIRQISYQAMSIDDLATNMSSAVGRFIINKTALTGKYDLKLSWVPDDTRQTSIQGPSNALGTDSGPSIFTAFGQELGLKLASGRGPVTVVVVDHVARPSEN